MSAFRFYFISVRSACCSFLHLAHSMTCIFKNARVSRFQQNTCCQLSVPAAFDNHVSWTAQIKVTLSSRTRITLSGSCSTKPVKGNIIMHAKHLNKASESNFRTEVSTSGSCSQKLFLLDSGIPATLAQLILQSREDRT